MRRGPGGAHAIGLASLLALIAPATARAEESLSPPALHAGATSVEFAVNTFGGAFDAGTIGVRRHFSPAWAARLALDVGINSANETTSYELFDGSGYFLGQGGRSSDSWDHHWRVEAQALWLPIRSEGFAFGFALGPEYDHASANRDDVFLYGPGSTTAARTSSEHTDFHRVGAACDATFEWFVHRRLSLRGRTGLDFGWTSRSRTAIFQDYGGGGAVLQTETDETSGSGFDLSAPSFGLGLAAYF